MRLRKILSEILREQEPDKDVIELPNLNFLISVDRAKKRLIFAPQGHSAVPSKLRTMIAMLKQSFNVLKVNSLEDEEDYDTPDDPTLRGTFEIEFDPRENLEEVIKFIREQETNRV